MTDLPKNRSVALAVFQAVLRDSRPLDEQADALSQALESRDRAFVRMLVATTLRRLGQIDLVINQCLDKPMPAKLATVRDVLRLGAAQLLFLETPVHAVVDTSVELVKRGRFAPYAGLTNAVLRRISRDGSRISDSVDAPRFNTPKWLWQDWSKTWGEETARQIGLAHLSEAPLDITLRPDQDQAVWATRLEATILPFGTLRRVMGGNVADLPGFDEGQWWIQDAAASLPARLLGDVRNKTIIDLCAAPGGKTMQLASAGATVTAVDRSARRLRRVASNLERLGLSATLVDADATQWKPDTLVDGVLLDAPCSATGTIRRHPDVARHKRPDDVRNLVATQTELLRAAVDMVRPGGLVVYCTCSLQKAEGEELVASALSAGLPVEGVPVTAEETGGLSALITPEGWLRTMPFHNSENGGMDGFFAARLRKLEA
ncbi:MFS transporter [Haematospirillum jordaniae]|uniref:RsmB/NOP family class I SAM-dependent RNA methyltransferase n=1 Tax=Haematospirillum jordaniae TaxID=1549855 RepID=UPI001432B225|nr:transcription antitermination factor NusB [Haematospirillum jordaniae]NKD86255.1 MFS transporter [Haematospirillum jordaniae]